jgi:hypothetical protein
MSDEAQDTPVAATKSLFGALAFIFLLLGAEMIAEKDGNRQIPGFVLIGFGIASTYAAVFWNYVRTKIPKVATIEINAIASSLRWWLALILLAVVALVFMPVIEHPRWPSWPPRTALTTVPTSMRLQFNASGEKPEEIEKRNMDLSIQRYTETKKTRDSTRRICTENAQAPPVIFTTPLYPSPPSYTCSDETFPQYADTRYVMFMLSFPYGIEPKEIKLNSHGANLPKWETVSLTGNSAIIRFSGELSRMVLDVEVVN